MTVDEIRKMAAKALFGQMVLPDDSGNFFNIKPTVKGNNIIYCLEYNGVIIYVNHDTVTGKYSISDNRNYYFYFRNDTDSCNDYDFYVHFGIDGCDDTEYCDNIVFEKYNISPKFNSAAENMYEPTKTLSTKDDMKSFLVSKGIRYEPNLDYISD